MTCLGAGRSLLLAAAIACTTWGCTAKVGDYTSAGKPVMNRDTTWTAVGIEFLHYRPSTLFAGRRIDQAFEIHTYDVAHRKGPRRIVRWVHDQSESPWIIGWDDSGLIVARGPIDAMVPVRVDPVTGASSPIASVPARSLEYWSESLTWKGKHRTHVFHGNEGYFLWKPRARQSEFLFPTPIESGEQLDPYMAATAARDRYADTFHRIWEVSARQEGDWTRFLVETYVPRPGEGSRLYLLSLSIEMPDTSEGGKHAFDDRRVPLAAQEMLVGPTAKTLVFPISNRRLLASLAPYRRTMHREMYWGSVPIRVWIKLRPMTLPEDEARLPLAHWTTSREDLTVRLKVPKAWFQ